MGDDAASGRRGARAVRWPGLPDLLGDEYGLQLKAGPADLGGSSNLNLLVEAATGRFVLRVYRGHVTSDRLATIQCVRQALVYAGIPAAAPVLTRSGAGWVAAEGRLAELERYVDADAAMDTWARGWRRSALAGPGSLGDGQAPAIR